MRAGGPPRIKLNELDLANFEVSLGQESQDAYTLAFETIQSHKITFLGEYGFISQELKFINTLIRRLPEAGVSLVGLEYLLEEDQSRIDRFMTSDVFNVEEARTLLLRRSPVFGYQEYEDLLRALWETRHREQNPRLRVIGLSYKENFSVITKQDDLQKPEILKQVLHKGSPDAFMANILSQAAKNTEGSLVVISQRRYSNINLEEPIYLNTLAKMGFPDPKHPGELLKQEFGADAVANILFHSPWDDQQSKFSTLSYPFNGYIDQALAHLGTERSPKLPAGIDLTKSVLGNTELDNNNFVDPENDKVLAKRLCNTYIILSPLKDLKPAQAIPDFINESNIDEAKARLPLASNPESLSPESMNSSIARNAKNIQQELTPFQ